MDNAIPLKQLVATFIVLFILGTILTLPLYNFSYQKLIHSKLFIKILFWIPIFGVFLFALYANSNLRIALLIVLTLCSLIEFIRVVTYGFNKPILVAYFILFALGLGHFYLLAHRYQVEFVSLLITLCFATVLSDVAAFFFGNYLGKHRLPGWLNSHKSWEGVAGQIVGSLLGVLLVNSFIDHAATIWLFLPIGVGSAIGDLANSFAKRQARIKDWGSAIPGHGGFIDRLSSVSGSCMALFYFLIITRVSI